MAAFKGGGLQLKNKGSAPTADNDSTIVYSDGDRLVTAGEFNEEIAFVTDINTLIAPVGIAGMNITMNRAVFIDSSDGLVYYATTSTPVDQMIFIAANGASTTEEVTLRFDGELITEASWSWTPGKHIFVAATNGLLTQTAPSSGNLFIIGTALSSTVIKINNQRAIAQI